MKPILFAFLVFFSMKLQAAEPVAVRYAYTQHPVGCNLYNKDNLPVAPFRTSGY